MGQDVEALRSDIERSREDLGETLDAIGDRVSPGRMITRRRNRMSESWRSAKDRVMGTVSSGTSSASGAVGSVTSSVSDHLGPDAVRQQAQGSPLGAGLVAFGIGFVVAAAFPPSQAEADMAETVMQKAEPVTSALTEAGREVAGDLKEQASDAAQQVKYTASEAAGQVKETASAEASAARDDVARTKDSMTSS